MKSIIFPTALKWSRIWGSPFRLLSTRAHRKIIDTSHLRKTLSQAATVAAVSSSDLDLDRVQKNLTDCAHMGIYTDAIAVALEEITLEKIRDMSISQLASTLGILANLENQECDTSALKDAIIVELTKSHRASAFSESRDKRLALSLIRSTARLSIRNEKLASLCLDSISPSTAYLTASEIVEVLSWMVAFGFNHSQYIQSVIRFVPVIPMTNEELGKIVTSLMRLSNNSLGKDGEFLERFLRFRLATVTTS